MHENLFNLKITAVFIKIFTEINSHILYNTGHLWARNSTSLLPYGVYIKYKMIFQVVWQLQSC